ncbi:TATA-binding protein associated factor Taf2 [Schizosaccharomyces japonicus yFS275]|uniref:Transcription initiation factor TFIID subunit 2 n=1 Tax=Schizosaccharomyces japonicus (strain yFS275 / FY16936) TaxID=402676 RepID=B6K841_SCHJY|nr:TATA-binding protein associated factor Taf2 [Schizosaccharomyces japonicus yFS275]EEB09695.1 TATA-binding protein associated factor Taf2 [Schizosaccharomyces japonicus yFS275]
MSHSTDAPARGYIIYKIAINVDFQGQTVKGYTEITINKTNPSLETVLLDCYQIDVSHVTVDGAEAVYEYSNALKRIRLSQTNSNVHQHHQLQSQMTAIAQELGGLTVHLPKTEEEHAKPFLIKVEYELRKPMCGLTFVGTDVVDKRYPHLYTSHSTLPYSASAWVPCFDSIWERCTWELEVTIPKTLLLVDGVSTVADLDAAESHDIEVICCGDLIDQATHPEDNTKKTVYFTVNTPVSAQYICFAAGPFHHINLTDFREAEDDDAMGSSAVEISGYYLPKYLDEVQNTCAFIYKAMDFFVREYGSYPFTTFKLCFVDEITIPVISSASMAIVGNSLLYPKDIIEPIYDSTRTLTWALASQWIGVYVIPKHWHDLWLIYGLSFYITGLFLRMLMGNNDYRFRLKMAVYKILELDVGRPPIASTDVSLPINLAALEFVALKAPMVIHILEQRLTKTGGSLGMSRVIPKLLLQAMSGDMHNGCLSTTHFLKTCEKASHIKLDVFAQQWIYGFGYPIFRVVQRFNRKKMIIEMGINQVQAKEMPKLSRNSLDFMDEATRHLNGETVKPVIPVFSGPMTIRIHEADGTPYEHVVELKDTFTKLDIQYNTKYKRISRNRSSKNVRKEGDDHGGLDSDYVIKSLGDILQTDEDVENWHLYDYTKEDEDAMATEAFEWIRVDADFEWICGLRVGQPEHMYVSQLQQDRDVVAQLEAIRYFCSDSFRPSRQVSTVLLRTLMDSRYYYGIRQEAALALAKCATEELEWIGHFHLRKAFLDKFCFENSTIPKSNVFSSIIDYYLKCTMVHAFSRIRDRKGDTPITVKKLLLDLLCFNDNANNELSDAHYICHLIEALVDALIPRGETMQFAFSDAGHMQFVKTVIAEIDRYLRIDGWMPSYCNVISRTALEGKNKLSQVFHLGFEVKDLFPYVQEGNFNLLRSKVFDLMLSIGALKVSSLMKYMFYMLVNDPSPCFRQNLVRSINYGFGVIARSSTKAETVDNDLVVEEDVNKAVEKRIDITSRASISGAIEALRHDMGKNEELANTLWETVNSTKIDLVTKQSLLNICRVLYETKSSLIVVLKIPSLVPHLRAIHLGKGKIVIKKAPLKTLPTKPAKTPHVIIKNTPPAPPAINTKPKGPTLRIKLTNLRKRSPSR